MKRLLCLVVIVGICIPHALAYADEFSDISGHWASQYIMELAQRGISMGTNDMEFEPDAQMTRAQFITMMNRAFPWAVSSGSTTPKEPFADVRTTDWYYNDVVRAVNSDLARGIGDGLFGANLPIMRQDACVLLERYIGGSLMTSQSDPDTISDYYAISDYARQAVLLMVGNEIFNGYPDGAFAPKDNITRAEVAALLIRVLDKTTSVSIPPSSYKITIDDIYDRLDGSTVTEPLSRAIFGELFGDWSLSNVIVNHNQTDAAIKNVIDGTKDLALVTYPSQENLDYAAENGIDLAIIPVVNDAFVFIVNELNSTESLTQDQIRGIYSGEATTWDEFGSMIYNWERYVENEGSYHFRNYGQSITALPPIPILPFQRNETSGSQSGMLTFMGETPISVLFNESQIVDAMGFLIDQVTFVPNSIGYSYLYYAKTMYMNNAKLIAVDGIAPTNENISGGDYPIITPYYAVYRADAALDSFPRAMVELLLSPSGQQLAERAGYVRLGTIPSLPLPGSYVRNIIKEFPMEDIYMRLRVEYLSAITSFARAVFREMYDDSIVREIVGRRTDDVKLDGLTDRRVDMVLRRELPTEEELAYAADIGIAFEITPIIGDKFGFFVHRDNPVNSLTMAELTKIYSGEITNWRQVGGNSRNILIVNNETGGGGTSQYYEIERFFEEFFEALPDGAPTPVSRYLVEWVGGNGFMVPPSPRITDMMTDNPAIIGHSLYSYENLQSYKFVEITDWDMYFDYYAITRKNEDADSFASRFTQHLLSEEIQLLAERMGSIRVN